MIILKSPHEIECIRKASKLTADTLSLLVEKAKPGITTLELDTIAEEYIRSHGGIPSCKGYYGFLQQSVLLSMKKSFMVFRALSASLKTAISSVLILYHLLMDITAIRL